MFEMIPDANFGLNLDPSHLLWQIIDYERTVYDFHERIFHVHANDMEINREQLYQRSMLSLGMGWQISRLPGLGEVNWGVSSARSTPSATTKCLASSTKTVGLKKTEDLVKRGFLIARNVLRPYLH